MPSLSFSVGAVFELVDEGTPVLERISGWFETLAGQMNEIKEAGAGLFSGMMESVTGAEAAGVRFGEAMVASMDRVDLAVSATATRISELAAALANLDRGAAGEGAPAGGGGRGSGRGGAGSGFVPLPLGPGETPLPGGFRDRPPSGYEGYDEANRMNQRYDTGQRQNAEAENRNRDQVERTRVREAEDRRAAVAGGVGGMAGGLAPLAGGLATYEALKGSMHEDLALTNTLIEAFHIMPGDPAFDKDKGRLRTMAHDASAGTVFSESQTASAMQDLARELGVAGEEGMGVLEAILRPALQAAEVAQQTGLGTIHNSMGAEIEYAHMTGASKDPAALEKHLNVLRSIAQVTNNTMRAEETILKYSVPIGMAAGMDPDKVAVETGYLQIRGFNASTAGTGLSAVILGALDTGGPLSAHLEKGRQSGEKELENALKLKPGDIGRDHGHGGKTSKHVKALEALGISKNGQLLAVDQAGNLDLEALQEDVYNYSHSHSHKDTLQMLHDAFGTRGERVAAMYTTEGYGASHMGFGAVIAGSPSAADIQKDLATTPQNQFEQMLANFANIGNTLATQTLPGLNAAMTTFNTGLVAANEWFTKNKTAAEAAGWTLVIGGATFAIGLLGKAAQAAAAGLGFLAGRGAGGAVPPVLVTPPVGSVPSAGGGGFWSGILNGITTGLALTVAEDVLMHLNDPKYQTGGEFNIKKLAGFPVGSKLGGGDPEHHTGTAPRAETQTVTVHMVNHNSLVGVPDDSSLRGLIAKLTDGLKTALTTMGSDNGGTFSSPYTQPAGL